MISLDYQSRTPIYEQIVNQFERLISLGVLKPKQQISSIRELATSLGINPNTVNKAYLELERQGFIKNLPKKGVYVCYGDEVKEDDEELINIIKELYNNDVKKEKLLEIIDLVYKEAKDDRD